MNQLPWNNKENSPARRKKALLFITCLALSFTAWMFIKLSRESATELPVKLAITNLPEGLIFTAQSDSVFIARIQSTGLKLLTSRLRRSVGLLETDFSGLQQIRRNNRDIFFITANQAESRFSMISEIPRHAVRMKPDTIFLNPEPAFRKKVPLILEKEIDFRPGYRLYDIPVLSPDSVEVSGPIQLRDSINFISTHTLRASSAESSIRTTIALNNPWKALLITLSHKQAEVFIPIEEFTEATAEIPLQIDCPGLTLEHESSELLLFPDHIQVYYLVALKDDKSISPDMFKAYVACPDTTTTGNFRLRTEIREKPGLVEIIRLRPQEVEYLWIKR